MTEIGRQQRHSGLHVATVAIPAEQGRDGEAMSKIMWPRSTPRGASAQAGLSDEVKPGEVQYKTRVPAMDTKNDGSTGRAQRRSRSRV